MADQGSGSGTAVDGTAKAPKDKLSYKGGKVPNTFDPKNLGTKFYSDIEKAYDKGPKVNPIKDYVPYSAETNSAITEGMGNADRTRDEFGAVATGDVGSSNPFYLSGPDYTQGVIGDVARGSYLGGGNPYLNAEIERTRDNVSNEINNTFASNGRFGADIHAEGLGKGLADSENTARFNQYNTDYDNMIEALGLQTGQAADRRTQFGTEYDRKVAAGNKLDAATATKLGYSGLIDAKAQEKNLSDQNAWDDKKNANFNHLAKYLGLMRGGDTANETNKPLRFWDILGTIGQTAGAFL